MIGVESERVEKKSGEGDESSSVTPNKHSSPT